MNKTKIEWCDWTWNPIVGCSPASAGCAHCYAATVAHQKKNHPNAKIRAAYEGLTDDKGKWTGQVRFLPERNDELLTMGKPGLVFAGSMTDMFHEAVRREWMAAVMDAMCGARERTYIVLTKRPERVLPWWQWWQRARGPRVWPPHVWLGVTAENQEMMLRRVDALMDLPAPVKVVSFEPLLGHVVVPYTWARQLAWMIAGPETGPGARPCEAEWIEALARQAEAARVAFFDKSKVGWIRREWPGGAPAGPAR